MLSLSYVRFKDFNKTTSSGDNAWCWHSGAITSRVVHSSNSLALRANRPGSAPTIHQCLEDDAGGFKRLLSSWLNVLWTMSGCLGESQGAAARRMQQQQHHLLLLLLLVHHLLHLLLLLLLLLLCQDNKIISKLEKLDFYILALNEAGFASYLFLQHSFLRSSRQKSNIETELHRFIFFIFLFFWKF